MSALAPVWVDALKRSGLTSSARVALWLDEHQGPPAPERVHMVIRRVRGDVGIMDLAAEEGVPHSRIQAMLRQAGMQLILPHLGSVAAWARTRDRGIGDESIADLSGIRPEIVTLALDGWPRPGAPLRDAQVVEAYSQWVAGAPLSEVAGILGYTPGRLRQELADGQSSLPGRLHCRDLAGRFGWNPSTVTRHRQEGTLPSPDGRDGLAYWWWASTVDQWEDDRGGLHPCPSCRAQYLTEAGLHGHITREH